jgi:hypothetical protein
VDSPALGAAAREEMNVVFHAADKNGRAIELF